MQLIFTGIVGMPFSKIIHAIQQRKHVIEHMMYSPWLLFVEV